MTHRIVLAILVVVASSLNAALVIVASPRASGAPPPGEQSSATVIFTPESPKYAAATEEYKRIWSTDGARIVATMERVSGLKFTEASIDATVFEGRSFSGLPSTPMKLRASYPLDTKRSALIHELGHRLNFQLAVWPKELDNHRVLYLYLYDVWSALYGQRFADEQAAVESGRTPPILLRWAGYNYRAAWKWALAKTPETRAELFGNILEAQSGQVPARTQRFPNDNVEIGFQPG